MLYNPPTRLQLRGSYGTKPTAAQKLFDIPMAVGDLLPSGAPNWGFIAEVAPTGNWTGNLTKNGAVIGSVTVGAGNTTGAWTFASTVTFAANDLLALVCPNPADGNLSGPGWFLRGSTILF